MKQAFRNIPSGKVGLTGLSDMVVQKEDRFFIIRPVSPETVLKTQLEKAGVRTSNMDPVAK